MTGATFTVPRGTELLFGSAKVTYNLMPPSRLGVVIGGGAALLNYGKATFDPDQSQSHVAGLAQVGLRFLIFVEGGEEGSA